MAPTESAIETPHDRPAPTAAGTCRNALQLLELEADLQPVSSRMCLYHLLACGADATALYATGERAAMRDNETQGQEGSGCSGICFRG